jgi:hypothetical protein
VSEGVPEEDGSHLLGAADEQADGAAVASPGIDQLGGRGALAVDRPGVVGPHAATPLSDGGRVARQGGVRVAPGPRRGRRGADRHACLGEGGDVFELGEAAVDQVLARPPVEARTSGARPAFAPVLAPPSGAPPSPPPSPWSTHKPIDPTNP